ncbi:MAG: flagellar basal body L-ring protein FlgH [Burkholderiaceae bacterium]|jgi:flagellar L-ring protein precursor FlgH|nr:flagellar basal body L-ring protein FlgH [Burkholderiales bacterium]MCE2677257.1 flagellar basal body L-ring protein FlgH [Burkholderiaceae bacterium]
MNKILSLLAVVAGLQACAHPDPMLPALTSSPDFAPVYPLVQDQTKPATGGIYGNRQSDAWFGRGRNYQVGDLITVILNESTQAARSQGTDISKDASNTALPAGISKFIAGSTSPFSGVDLNASTTKSTGKGTADQKASLSGSITVTVIEILANGNMVVRGEKKLGLSEGTEVIQVSGVIRPNDVGPNGTVNSLRLANAQIAYRGSGDLASASKPGWGTTALMKFWPF